MVRIDGYPAAQESGVLPILDRRVVTDYSTWLIVSRPDSKSKFVSFELAQVKPGFMTEQH